MVSKSLRMKASFSPTGSVEPESPSTEGTASPSLNSPFTPCSSRRRLQSLAKLEENSKLGKKYIHVHHFKNTKLFGAWFNDPSKAGKKVRLFFGSHHTAYLAARAQDRAALKYKPYASDPRSIKLNFEEEDYAADEKLRDMLTCDEFGELLRKESRPKYTKMEPTPCLLKFLAEERSRGNLPSGVPPKPEDGIISLSQYLKKVIQKRVQASVDLEDPILIDESSEDDTESSDEDVDGPVPTAARIADKKNQALEVEPKSHRTGKRSITTRKPRITCASPEAEPAEEQPVNRVVWVPLLSWGQSRPRTKRYAERRPLRGPLAPVQATAFKLPNKLQQKFNNASSSKQSGEYSRTVPEAPPPEVENHWSPTAASAEAKLKSLLTAMNNEKPEILQAGGEENPKSCAVPGGVPPNPHLQFQNKWQYKLHRVQQMEVAEASTETKEPSLKRTKLQSISETHATEMKTTLGSLVRAETESDRRPAEMKNAKSPEPEPEPEPEPVAVAETEIVPAQVENPKSCEPALPDADNSPPFRELKFRNKWQFKMHKVHNVQELVPARKPSPGLMLLASIFLAPDGKED